MVVPPILSQTWSTQTLPPRAAALRADWAALNPGLGLRLYDDAACRAVMAEVAPEHLAAYDAVPFGVMRADLFRLAVVLRDGGVYADVDMQPLRALPQDLFERSCSVSVEARLSKQRQRELGYRHPYQIANCIFAARPHHPFLRAALDHAAACIRACPQPTRDQIEDLTGPRMLTRLLQQHDWPDVWIGAQLQLMAPLGLPDAWPVNRHMVTRHETHGTWKRDADRPVPFRRTWIERNRVVNPFRAPRWWPAPDFWARA
ncbi:MAG: glycosyltransferase [Roseovarius sp.]